MLPVPLQSSVQNSKEDNMNTYDVNTILLSDDYEGKVRASLIHKTCAVSGSKVVLYIHGYIDYFFQHHVADFFCKNGYEFYALELRKYGRSLMSHQTANYCRNLREYYPEIDEAIRFICHHHPEAHIALLGHSTGGLVSSLYLTEGKERKRVSCLILNSPFFEFNTSMWKKKMEIPLAASISYLLPYLHKENELNPFYIASISKRYKGEWDFREDWKPDEGFPLYFAWLRAIRKAQKKVKKGLNISQPILCMSSDKSIYEEHWSEIFFFGDAVLNVDDIRRACPKLGKNVTYLAIQDGLHDLYLSRVDVREKALEASLEFMERNLN